MPGPALSGFSVSIRDTVQAPAFYGLNRWKPGVVHKITVFKHDANLHLPECFQKAGGDYPYHCQADRCLSGEKNSCPVLCHIDMTALEAVYSPRLGYYITGRTIR